MVDAIRRNLLVGTGLCAASALTGRGHAHSLEPDAQGPTLSDEGWDADAPPELEFMFEARVQLHLPPMNVGAIPDGNRLIYFVKGGTFDGPHMRGRVVPDAGADWVRIRPDGSGVLDVRFSLETHDSALVYVHWSGRFWSAPEDAEYATDLEKPDDPAGAWRYYFRTAPQFETGDPRYKWLNNIIAVTKSRTGNGGPIHRVFAVM
ncbi:DUF3237 domain-containing protein [Roseobacter sp.]|uniref:DUF3237 domain-containing protein n=1 Tax=Roseobacter sp. TaxID=1907202 RepID=UPI002966121A|nr:DUF3237 domain-containing protein [Roseobacter sp.]MDW3182724.1 DUF3237 domain-containing protein [Roseobacter sp.]